MKNSMAPYYKQRIKKGVVLGSLVPIVFSPLVCFILYSYRSPKKPDGTYFKFWDFYDAVITHETQFPTFLILCLLCNLPIFLLLMRKKKDWLAKGMMYSTLGYAVVYFVLKFY